MGVGVVALGLGVFRGLKAKDASDQDSHVQGMWTSADDQLVKEGQDADSEAKIFFAVGGVAVIGGGLLWYAGHGRTATERVPSTSMVPVVGPHEAGLVFHSSF